MGIFKKIDSTLAIDLAPDAVRVLDVSLKRGTPEVTAFATQALVDGPPESLPERHLQAIEKMIAIHRMRTRNCVAAMPTNLVVTRAVSIDNSKNQAWDEQVRWTLQNCLPFNPNDLIFDFWPVGDPKANTRTHEVLVVACQGSVVQRYLNGFEKLGLTCSHLDVAPCAVASLIAHMNSDNHNSMVGTIAICENAGYFAVVEKKKVLFWRPFDLPRAAQKAVSATQSCMDRVGDEISKCVSHMVGTMHLDALTELLVFGHGSADEQFSEYLKNRFHLPVRAPSPFQAMPDRAISADLRAAIKPEEATHYAAAAGLALEPAGVTHG